MISGKGLNGVSGTNEKFSAVVCVRQQVVDVLSGSPQPALDTLRDDDYIATVLR